MKFSHCVETNVQNREKSKNLPCKHRIRHNILENDKKSTKKLKILHKNHKKFTFSRISWLCWHLIRVRMTRALSLRMLFCVRFVFSNFLAGKPILNFSWWNSKQKSETKETAEGKYSEDFHVKSFKMDENELYFNEDDTFFRENGLLVGTRNPMLTEIPVSTYWKFWWNVFAEFNYIFTGFHYVFTKFHYTLW